mmetsp:Transcript_9012/g.9995  ORF Transcript_9012/g.9995 Transcript_9012/m.9995 type:complete len:147 (+) Transcript_9012:137-577(+)
MAKGGMGQLQMVILVLAIIVNAMVIVTGVIGVVKSGFPDWNWEAEINNNNAGWAISFLGIFLVVLAVLGILGEFQIKVYLDRISIWVKWWTRTVWYVLIGFLCVGLAGLVGIVSAFLCWVLALIFLILEFIECCGGERQSSKPDKK